MLLVHQAGSVKVGEVVRYTLTYTPSNDRILPSPNHLHLKIKNTSAIPLRAAYLHGPYTLHVSAYPSTFNPNVKVEDPKRYGVPDFEPLLKAGGHWTSELTVPQEIRETGASLGKSNDGDKSKGNEPKSVTWIVEVASQILFSNSAVVHFEVLVGRDERSLELGFAAVAGHGHGVPGQMSDHKEKDPKTHKSHSQKGVYSKAIKLVCEDTEALWDKPALPKSQETHNAKKRVKRESKDLPTRDADDKEKDDDKPVKKQKIHLVVLTHGLHSNIGADMLYLKESIDATVKQARLDARKRKAEYKARQREKATSQKSEQTKDEKTSSNDVPSTAPLSGGQEELQDNDDEGSDDEEQTIVRGFTGNAVRTEKGIQYLGKRLAKFILHFTYPDQPFLPVKKSMTRSLTDSFKSNSSKAARDGKPAHEGSSIHVGQEQRARKHDLPYTFTSISFVGHSLGGLIQTYAIAYIQKHAPAFFTQIQPVNFICLASPLLGLSNENPMYVKFALDFGLVGRTGQDLGLTWRAPTLAKSGWGNLVNGFGGGSDKEKHKEADPGAKPLLRILPTGPAHTVLRMFRNRTVYANVVNDGIVPLRTSSLLFLDWRGLGKVDKARRENGLIGTMAEWGWAELTGTNALSKSHKYGEMNTDDNDSGTSTPTQIGKGDTVPQPAEDATTQDNKTSRTSPVKAEESASAAQEHGSVSSGTSPPTSAPSGGLLDSFMSFLRPSKAQSRKVTKAIIRGQTMSPSPPESASNLSQDERDSGEHHDAERRSLISRGSTENPTMMHPHGASAMAGKKGRPGMSRGYSIDTDPLAPPRTSIFESASDILHPPIPSTSWIIDPSSRTRTIFHDRIYHPEDIPPPPPPHRPSLARTLSGRGGRSFSSDSLRSNPSRDTNKSPNPGTPSSSILSNPAVSSPDLNSGEVGSMKVEEKIARAYHRDLSWRKVLVRLEPDAHNNMIVRRMFANAYGWPVVKHLCDTHFADTWSARVRDEDEAKWDRAQGLKTTEHTGTAGEEVKGQTDQEAPARSKSELREDRDELGALGEVGTGVDRHRTLYSVREGLGVGNVSVGPDIQGSGVWDDVYFEGGSDDDEEEGDDSYGSRFQKMVGHWGYGAGGRQHSADPSAAATNPSSPPRALSSSSSLSSPSSPSSHRRSGKKKMMVRKSSGGSGRRQNNNKSPIRTSSGGAQPVLSSDTATGHFVPPSSTSPFSSSSSPQQLQQTSILTDEEEENAAAKTRFVAEPEAMTSNEEVVDPGNLTPTPIMTPSATASSKITGEEGESDHRGLGIFEKSTGRDIIGGGKADVVDGDGAGNSGGGGGGGNLDTMMTTRVGLREGGGSVVEEALSPLPASSFVENVARLSGAAGADAGAGADASAGGVSSKKEE